jgi:hypothetical protein
MMYRSSAYLEFVRGQMCVAPDDLEVDLDLRSQRSQVRILRDAPKSSEKSAGG